MLIYLITNDVNSKAYVGQATQSLSERIYQHHLAVKEGQTTHLCNAMRKYGPENFHFHVLAHASSQQELDELECFYIAKYDSIQNGYNMKDGGSANPIDWPKSKQKHDARMRDPEVKQRISESMKASYKARGGPSATHRARLSESRKALYASPEGDKIREKFRKSFVLTPEHYRALNDAKNKAVYCINESGVTVAEFKRVKDAAQWWYDQGYVVKGISQLCDKIKESYRQDKYIRGLKWIYRV